MKHRARARACAITSFERIRRFLGICNPQFADPRRARDQFSRYDRRFFFSRDVIISKRTIIESLNKRTGRQMTRFPTTTVDDVQL